jgi:hypothetical protein
LTFLDIASNSAKLGGPAALQILFSSAMKHFSAGVRSA